VFLRGVRRVLVTATFVPISQILVTLMEELRSSETSVLKRATRRNFPEGAIVKNHGLSFCLFAFIGCNMFFIICLNLCAVLFFFQRSYFV
jgi:hypothetical protein